MKVREWSLIMGRGEATKREGGVSEFYHYKRGGGRKKFQPCVRGGGGAQQVLR